jgi:hypothetical protein
MKETTTVEVRFKSGSFLTVENVFDVELKDAVLYLECEDGTELFIPHSAYESAINDPAADS